MWTAVHQSAFEELRTAMTTTPVLIFANMGKPFTVTTDASLTAIGWILSQEGDDGKLHPISYSGRSLSPAERNYSIEEVECLSLVSAITEHSHFLTAMPFTVLTDHQSLQYLKTVKNTGNRRIFRWMLQLQS